MWRESVPGGAWRHDAASVLRCSFGNRLVVARGWTAPPIRMPAKSTWAVEILVMSNINKWQSLSYRMVCGFDVAISTGALVQRVS